MLNPEQLEYVENVSMGLDELNTEIEQKFANEWNPLDPDLTTSLQLQCVKEALSYINLCIEHQKHAQDDIDNPPPPPIIIGLNL